MVENSTPHTIATQQAQAATDIHALRRLRIYFAFLVIFTVRCS